MECQAVLRGLHRVLAPAGRFISVAWGADRRQALLRSGGLFEVQVHQLPGEAVQRPWVGSVFGFGTALLVVRCNARMPRLPDTMVQCIEEDEGLQLVIELGDVCRSSVQLDLASHELHLSTPSLGQRSASWRAWHIRLGRGPCFKEDILKLLGLSAHLEMSYAFPCPVDVDSAKVRWMKVESSCLQLRVGPRNKRDEELDCSSDPARSAPSIDPCSSRAVKVMGSGASAPKDMASGAKELLGEHLIKCGGDEKVSVEEALKDKKAVALYFSAHWCPPCRGFTPKLAEAYTSHLKETGLEVIFVSSDRDDASWKEYCGEMPWLALPREAKGPVASKFKVRGIPTMIILDPTDGSIITEDGRSAVMKDPTGEKFPWKPPTFKELG
eukprot:g14021.t1